jgi:hypothetical protein
LLLNAARATPFVLERPAPFVLQTSLNDYHVSYEINIYTDRPREMLNIYSELHRYIQDQFNARAWKSCHLATRPCVTATKPPSRRNTAPKITERPCFVWTANEAIDRTTPRYCRG